jgi:hypothetical protein
VPIFRTVIAAMIIAIVLDLFFAGVVYWCYLKAKENPDAITERGIRATRRQRFRIMLIGWIGITIYLAFITWRYFNTRIF